MAKGCSTVKVVGGSGGLLTLAVLVRWFSYDAETNHVTTGTCCGGHGESPYATCLVSFAPMLLV